jgi:hypothetical protein
MPYALILNGVVAEIAAAEFPVAAPLAWIACDATVQLGWTCGGVPPAFAPPPLAALTPAQQAAGAIAAGLTITSPSLGLTSVTFACDPATADHLNNEVTSLLLTGAFLDGSASIVWPTLSAVPPGGAFIVSLTVAQFKTLALTIGAFVGAATKVVLGIPGAAVPAAAVTIP